MAAVSEIKELSAYELATLADCSYPDGRTSEGALFLNGVRDAVIGSFVAGELTEDEIHEIADSAPSIYTYTLWQQFADLAAYNEVLDVMPDSLSDAANVALYQIADRLATELARMLNDNYDDDDEEKDGDDSI